MALVAALLAGSARAQAAPPAPDGAALPGPNAELAQPYDPWEGLNRRVFAFSNGLDHHLIGPVVHGYMRATPLPIRNRVTSVVYNLWEPGNALDDLLQAHPRRAAKSTARFAINSTIGLLGLFDVATGMGIEGHDSDFGQTLGRYGAQAGPYLYVPVIGPLDLRDGIGRVVDIVIDPVSLIPGASRTSFKTSRAVLGGLESRVAQDTALRALDDGIDPYATARSAYTQHRVFVVQQATGAVAELPDFEPPSGEPQPSMPPLDKLPPDKP
ncbi:VacJ family lipoprotein [Phenylobacterium sp.]|uniref:MlaA family lipoprotein n=1 Tax=Phenylobacterium sp. TaxID=1871053 RepID=UPI0025FD7976|nr:VacJ family lipoprotein [Phenylobacterium sp.]